MVNDGGQTNTITLYSTRVAGGVVGLELKSAKVAATLRIGKLSASATFEPSK